MSKRRASEMGSGSNAPATKRVHEQSDFGTTSSKVIKRKRRISRTKTGKLEAEVKRLASRIPNNPKYATQYNSTYSGLVLSSPLVVLLNGITEGSDETNRIGDRMKFKWNDIRLQVYATNNLLASGSFRVMVVREKTALGSALAPAQFLQSATPNTTAQRNVTTRDHTRYVVYYDETFLLFPAVSSAASPINVSGPDEYNIRIQTPLNFITDFSRGNAGTIADIDTNSLYLLVFTDINTASSVNLIYSYITAGDDA